MQTAQKKAYGTLRISREVLATIAEAAAREIPGVYATAGSLYGMVRSGESHGASVIVNDDLAQVRLRLVLESDARIQDVTARVQQAVKDAVQNMTDITVSKVNIVVAGIHYAAAQEEK
jgi:uncharacterized alkaline shock family protein YloU